MIRLNAYLVEDLDGQAIGVFNTRQLRPHREARLRIESDGGSNGGSNRRRLRDDDGNNTEDQSEYSVPEDQPDDSDYEIDVMQINVIVHNQSELTGSEKLLATSTPRSQWEGENAMTVVHESPTVHNESGLVNDTLQPGETTIKQEPFPEDGEKADDIIIGSSSSPSAISNGGSYLKLKSLDELRIKDVRTCDDPTMMDWKTTRRRRIVSPIARTPLI